MYNTEAGHTLRQATLWFEGRRVGLGPSAQGSTVPMLVGEKQNVMHCHALLPTSL